MWVKFTADYDFSPDDLKGRHTTAYKAGMVQNVTRECAEKAIAAGKATATRRADKIKETAYVDAS
ncbi:MULTISPECIES: hypothetical protein [unclassified Mesorhizobium]|uniref:hypothetical protein n=1 Tax=unclassified Mesorhizobium TaxID=325217 RepID=UPI0015E36B9B|nr:MULTISPECIES: hypothetical protein [unclassified Mesorhizobium]